MNKKKASSKEKPGTKDKIIVIEAVNDFEHRIQLLERRLGIISERDR